MEILLNKNNFAHFPPVLEYTEEIFLTALARAF